MIDGDRMTPSMGSRLRLRIGGEEAVIVTILPSGAARLRLGQSVLTPSGTRGAGELRRPDRQQGRNAWPDSSRRPHADSRATVCRQMKSPNGWGCDCWRRSSEGPRRPPPRGEEVTTITNASGRHSEIRLARKCGLECGLADALMLEATDYAAFRNKNAAR